MEQNIMMLWIIAWVSALAFAFWRLKWVESQSQGTDEIAKIAGHIRRGLWLSLIGNTGSWLFLFCCSNPTVRGPIQKNRGCCFVVYIWSFVPDWLDWNVVNNRQQ